MLGLALLPIAHPIPHAPEHLGVSGAISDGLGDVRFTPESEQLLHCREVTLRVIGEIGQAVRSLVSTFRWRHGPFSIFLGEVHKKPSISSCHEIFLIAGT
jgi:hypothetical protein